MTRRQHVEVVSKSLLDRFVEDDDKNIISVAANLDGDGYIILYEDASSLMQA